MQPKNRKEFGHFHDNKDENVTAGPQKGMVIVGIRAALRMREVVAVAERYRIGRRPRYSSRRYDWRMRAVGIMHMPQQTGNMGVSL
jgi:hypothetical protein